MWSRPGVAAIYPDKTGNAGDITLSPPVVSASTSDIDYTVPYDVMDSTGAKSGEYRISSQMLPGRDIATPSDDFVLTVFVIDDATSKAAELTFRNNPNVAPAAPILRLLDCSSGTCNEDKRYDDPQYGAWVITDRLDVANYPIELIDAHVLVHLLDAEQLSGLPNSADGTGNWAAIMSHHRTNFEEAKFAMDIDHLGDVQSDLLTQRMIAELESKNDCSFDDWLIRHWCDYPECDVAGVGLDHGTMDFVIGHKDLIESLMDSLFDQHFNDWPLAGEVGEFTFPFGRMPVWRVDAEHEHDFDTPCVPDGPTSQCHLLPLHWERVMNGFGRSSTGECTFAVEPLGIPGCYHDYPVPSYVPTLTPTPGAFTGPGETNNIGASECATVVGPDGFVDRPCTDAADYTGNITATESGAYHNDIHGFIGGGFGPAETTAGTMVFWAFHANVSTNVLANWRHAQRRDVGTPQRICNAQSYEAETMFHSTGGTAPGGWNIWSNGFISTTHTFTPGPARITVRARGQQAAGVWPHMVVSVDGVPVGNVFVSSSTFTDYSFQFTAGAGPQTIAIAFDNDFFAPPADRNLFVDRASITCVDPASGPCGAFCADPQVFTWSGSYQSGNLGTGALCRETTHAVVGGNCGNFATGRQLFLNGVQMPCNSGNWSSLPPASNGGYCVQVTPGNFSYAFLTLW